MAHIAVNEQLPGIVGLLHFRPETAAAFCMYNRYVDGLATWAPRDNAAYNDMGRMLAFDGYTQATPK